MTKIYTRVVIDMDSMAVLSEDSFEYDGPLALCGGGDDGGSSTTVNNSGENVDPEAQRRMAAVAERQAALSEQQWGYYLQQFQPLDTAMAQANLDLVGPQSELQKAVVQENLNLIPARSQATQKYYNILNGTDLKQKAVDEASADVNQAFGSAKDDYRKTASRLGIDPNSGRFTESLKDLERDQALGLAGARTSARKQAEEQEFSRYASSQGLPYNQGQESFGGYQLTSPADRAVQLLAGASQSNNSGLFKTNWSSGSTTTTQGGGGGFGSIFGSALGGVGSLAMGAGALGWSPFKAAG